jgi:hypothetical protein
MAFIISNIEPFDTEKDAEVAAEKLGEDYEVYSVDEDQFEDEDLDVDEDLDEDEDEEENLG